MRRLAEKYSLSLRLLAAAVLLPANCQVATAEGDQSESVAAVRADRHFTLEVLPVLKARCFGCHGEKTADVKGKFDVTTRDGLLRGGESEQAAVVPGKPEESLLLDAVRWDGLEMPPKENDRLTARQIEAVRQWIADGAPWPSAEAQRRYTAEARATSGGNEILVATRGGLSDDWTQRRYASENLWAYRPLADAARPAFADGAQPASESASRTDAVRTLDRRIEQRLDELGLPPAPRADRRTLIRRATFDLLGLPPTPEQVAEFVNDPAPEDQAWSSLVERLLASPHYGEQWGRHWLDVVRYADSSGYANDYERGNAWRYRDYVVRSFNEDKPYDRFIREQLAGDEIQPENPEMRIAVGMLRMGPWELTGMEVAKVARQRFLDDVTDIVGQVFLGQMLQCARCHDHKFDPIPTRDYYAVQAAFATTQLAERPAPFLPDENTEGFEEKKYLLQRRDYYQKILHELDRKSIAAARQWYAGDARRDSTAFEKLVTEKQGGPDTRGRPFNYESIRRALRQQGLDEQQVPPRHAGFEPRDFGMERVARKGLERIGWSLERYEPVALSVYSGRTPVLKGVYAPLRMPADPLSKGTLEVTCILSGGDPFSPGEPVEPAALSAATNLAAGGLNEIAFPAAIEGRRTALADWIASPHNPLTARVMVNRIWQWHFGQPLAGNPNNFGATGKKPTHPELLDWLAARFIAGGWSIKEMHRLILHSETYRRSSRHPAPDELEKRDPNGQSYAAFPPRRLDAEELRDAMLLVSGELNATLGGIPVRPEINLEAALQPRMVMGTFAEAWQPSPLPSQRHRRSLYIHRIRGQRDPFQEVFNAPGAEVSCEAREASTVTPQVFALFNSPRVYDRALAMAHDLMKSKGDAGEILARAFQRVYGRPASDDQVQLCLTHWKAMTARHRDLHFEPPRYPRQVVREAVEENTGEKFTFIEPLEVYADFVPDLKPSETTAEVRGLAEVCLVLLNSNEFAYVE